MKHARFLDSTMRSGWLDWWLTFLAGVAGLLFLGFAGYCAANDDFGWAALLCVLAVPGLVAGYRSVRMPDASGGEDGPTRQEVSQVLGKVGAIVGTVVMVGVAFCAALLTVLFSALACWGSCPYDQDLMTWFVWAGFAAALLGTVLVIPSRTRLAGYGLLMLPTFLAFVSLVAMGG